MRYHLDAERISLDEVRKRIEETDLIPSRTSLLDGISTKIKALKQHGVTTLASLQKELENSRRLEALSNTTGIDRQYLTLLRREINGYFPKPPALKDFDWLPGGEIATLEEKGIRHAAGLYETTSSLEDRTELAKSTGVDMAILEELFRLADLTRVRWVSPTTARMLVEAGYDSASKVAAANAEDLYEALVCVNEGEKFFKERSACVTSNDLSGPLLTSLSEC